MALAVSLLTGANSTTDATSFTTASVSPSDNALVLVGIAGLKASAPVKPTVSGGGMAAWTEAADNTYRATGNIARITVYRALEATPGTGTIVIDFAGTTMEACEWHVFEATGVDTGGANGANAIVQMVKTNAALDPVGTAVSLTLAALGSANNIAAGFVGHIFDQTTTPGTGYTELADTKTITPIHNLQSQHKLNTTTFDASWANSVRYCAIAFEIKEATAAAAASLLYQPLPPIRRF